MGLGINTIANVCGASLAPVIGGAAHRAATFGALILGSKRWAEASSSSRAPRFRRLVACLRSLGQALGSTLCGGLLALGMGESTPLAGVIALLALAALSMRPAGSRRPTAA